ncbi:MAG: hypothetical protein ACKV2V_01205, partial [Blastocatellia bacterium]
IFPAGYSRRYRSGYRIGARRVEPHAQVEIFCMISRDLPGLPCSDKVPLTLQVAHKTRHNTEGKR